MNTKRAPLLRILASRVAAGVACAAGILAGCGIAATGIKRASVRNMKSFRMDAGRIWNRTIVAPTPSPHKRRVLSFPYFAIPDVICPLISLTGE